MISEFAGRLPSRSRRVRDLWPQVSSRFCFLYL